MPVAACGAGRALLRLLRVARRRRTDPARELARDGGEVEGVVIDAELDVRADDERAHDERSEQRVDARTQAAGRREFAQELLNAGIPALMNRAERRAGVGVAAAARAELFEDDDEVRGFLEDAPGVHEVREQRIVDTLVVPAAARVELIAGELDQGGDERFLRA